MPRPCHSPIKDRNRSTLTTLEFNGGGGIRTPGTLSSTLVFETSPISHSGTSPRNYRFLRMPRFVRGWQYGRGGGGGQRPDGGSRCGDSCRGSPRERYSSRGGRL